MSITPEPAPRKPAADADNWAAPPLIHPDDPSRQEAAPAPQRSVTFRIMLIGMVLIFVNCYWVIEVEGIWHSNHATAMSLFWNTTFFLLLLVLFNMFVHPQEKPRSLPILGRLRVRVLPGRTDHLLRDDDYRLRARRSRLPATRHSRRRGLSSLVSEPAEFAGLG